VISSEFGDLLPNFLSLVTPNSELFWGRTDGKDQKSNC
jgi:hypothetical protein